eukprot:jgi/Chrzof1/6098/Cz17g09180.t1
MASEGVDALVRNAESAAVAPAVSNAESAAVGPAVEKKFTTWADEVEEYDDAVAEAAAAAPQGRDVNGYSHPDMHGSSSQGSALSVYLADVPADVRPRDVYAAFDGLKVANVRLHGGDGNRPCCFVDFDHPDDVSTVLAMREVQLLGHTVLLKPAATAATASEGPRFKPAGSYDDGYVARGVAAAGPHDRYGPAPPHVYSHHPAAVAGGGRDYYAGPPPDRYSHGPGDYNPHTGR